MVSRRRRGRNLPPDPDPDPDPDNIVLVAPQNASAIYCSRHTDHREFIYGVRRFARNNSSDFVFLSGRQNMVIQLIDDNRDMFLYMDRESLYIWGLHCGGKNVVFNGYAGLDQAIELPYSSGYFDLHNQFVGIGVFEYHITNLIDQVMAPTMTRNANPSIFHAIRHSFFSVIIHVSEAIRFQLVTFFARLSKLPGNDQSTPVDGWLSVVLTNWSNLSGAVDRYRPPDVDETDPPKLNRNEKRLLLGRVEPNVPYSTNLRRVKKNGNILRNLVSVSINYLKVVTEVVTDQENVV